MIDVESVCTDQDVINECGSHREYSALLPPERNGSSLVDRVLVLRDVVIALGKRTPPLSENDIGRPEQLNRAVTLGVMARLYRIAMTSADDKFGAKHKLYSNDFESELKTMVVTTSGGSQAMPGALAVFRR